MNTREAYNLWALQYDTNHNKTRDLEALALRASLANIPFDTCLEIGCGTGKNTVWLAEKAALVTAVDLSEEMLEKAKNKVNPEKIDFIQADITAGWTFAGEEKYNLICFSLVLEHIADLDPIFREASKALLPDGYIYIGELHPFKQYSGTKARFDTENGRQVLQCYNHHISDFILAARQYGFVLVDVNEHFDNNDRTTLPRILTMILQKPVFTASS